jgi:4-hydroxybenzoate polyprenyltransferase
MGASPGTARRSAGGLLDALVFSSLWVAVAAAVLAAAASVALGGTPAVEVVGLAFTGTLAVYGIDRLRDLERDRATTPARSAFVEGHRRALIGLAVAATVAAIGCVVALGGRPLEIGALVGVVGLLHRRLKRVAFLKGIYVAAAWTAVTVGLPAAAARRPAGPADVGWAAAILGLALLGNAIASNVRDGEAAAALIGARTALRVARASALAGVAIGLLAPPAFRPLAAVPVVVLLALAAFRADERYGLVVVDGALVAGGLLALALH